MSFNRELLREATDQAIEEHSELEVMRPKHGLMIRAKSRDHLDAFLSHLDPYLRDILSSCETQTVGQRFFVVCNHFEKANMIKTRINHVLDIFNKALIAQDFEPNWYENLIAEENAGGIDVVMKHSLTDIDKAEALAVEDERSQERINFIQGIKKSNRDRAFYVKESGNIGLVEGIADYLVNCWNGFEDEERTRILVADAVHKGLVAIPRTGFFLQVHSQRPMLDLMKAKTEAMNPDSPTLFWKVVMDIEYAASESKRVELDEKIIAAVTEAVLEWPVGDDIEQKPYNGWETENIAAGTMRGNMDPETVSESLEQGATRLEMIANGIAQTIIDIAELKHDGAFESALKARCRVLDKEPLDFDMIQLIIQTRPRWK